MQMKKQENTIIITHSADPDGIISAVFIAAMLESIDVTYEFQFVDYPNITEVIGKTAMETDRSIYILDLGLLKADIPDKVIQLMLENNAVHYFDHHEIDVERRELLKQGLTTYVSVSKNICTARLIAEHYKFKGNEYKILADCAQATDYDGTVGLELTMLGTELAQAISPDSGLALEKIVHTIKEGLHNHRVWRNGYKLTGYLAEGAAKTRQAMEVATIQLNESASCHELFKVSDSPVLVAIALSGDSLYMKPGYQVLKQKFPQAHVCFVLYESGSVFAGPGQSGEQAIVPLLAFLKEQGGGGRNSMGGFNDKIPTDIRNYKKKRDALLQKYENFLKRGYSG